MAKERSNQKRHTGAKATAAAAVILALLAGGHYGLGIGRGEGGALLPNQQGAQPAPQETAAPAATEEAPLANDGTLTVTVRETELLYNGASVTLDELEAALLADFRDGKTVTLTDDHAIKASFDEAAALLDRLSIPYTVS